MDDKRFEKLLGDSQELINLKEFREDRERVKKINFEMSLEPHTPSDPERPCFDCVLQSGLCCLDRSYCKFKETGKTWKKSL